MIFSSLCLSIWSPVLWAEQGTELKKCTRRSSCLFRVILASCDKSISRFNRSTTTRICHIGPVYEPPTVPKLSSFYYDKRPLTRPHSLNPLTTTNAILTDNHHASTSSITTSDGRYPTIDNSKERITCASTEIRPLMLLVSVVVFSCLCSLSLYLFFLLISLLFSLILRAFRVCVFSLSFSFSANVW